MKARGPTSRKRPGIVSPFEIVSMNSVSNRRSLFLKTVIMCRIQLLGLAANRGNPDNIS